MNLELGLDWKFFFVFIYNNIYINSPVLCHQRYLHFVYAIRFSLSFFLHRVHFVGGMKI